MLEDKRMNYNDVFYLSGNDNDFLHLCVYGCTCMKMESQAEIRL